MMIIEYMHIKSYCHSCSCDYLQVQNGFSSDGYIGERRCGTYSNIMYYSMFESLKVLFVSDGSSSKQYRGFKATYIQRNNAALSSSKLKKKKKSKKKRGGGGGGRDEGREQISGL